MQLEQRGNLDKLDQRVKWDRQDRGEFKVVLVTLDTQDQLAKQDQWAVLDLLV